MKGTALLATALLSSSFCGASPEPLAEETPAQHDARMAWWRDARFGMFIHWGVYAVPAGTYRDQKIEGIGEWIMRNGRIPVAEYRAFAKDFNPVKYEPAAWAALAREAGMRYMVITAKHHDGFALFPSDVTDWDIADASPYGKDLIGPLAKAARAEGLKFGLYYSQAQDWTHRGGAKSGYKEGDGWDEAHKGDFDQYLDSIAAPQVREILTRYQPDILWWDTPTWMNTERADQLLPLTALRPGLITNNRLGGGYTGDTDTPEQHIPATGISGRDWETCMTMNDTWGFKSDDQNWKPVETLVRNLVDIVSKGGNYLLNVGPTAAGEIPQPSIERLQAVGKWMKTNGEAIHGTSASPFHRLPWGRCTVKTGAPSDTLYLHVFEWPKDGKLAVPGLRGTLAGARVLGGAETTATPTAEGVVIDLPASMPDPLATVVALRIQPGWTVEALPLKPAADGTITLTPNHAALHQPEAGEHLRVEAKYGADNIGFWLSPQAWISWAVHTETEARYTVTAEIALPAGTKARLAIDATGLDLQLPPTGGYEKFQSVDLGTIKIAPGRHEISLKPVEDSWKPLNLRQIKLTPAP